jgi:hypothetical protein
MVYNTQNYWVFGLFPSSGILETRKQRCFGNWICLRLQVKGEKISSQLGSLERPNFNPVHKVNNCINIPLSQTFRSYIQNLD